MRRRDPPLKGSSVLFAKHVLRPGCACRLTLWAQHFAANRAAPFGALGKIVPVKVAAAKVHLQLCFRVGIWAQTRVRLWSWPPGHVPIHLEQELSA